jgi:3'-phosphoadenosine 5'-phosphosulfate sulfotransferase (PAPS reductase)/FAD synthetase
MRGVAVSKHVVFFSGGMASFVAASRAVERYGVDAVTLLFTDTLIEDADTYRFMDEASAALGVPLVKIADGRTPWQVFADQKFLGNNRVPLCSRVLKQEVAQRWVDEYAPDAILHFGIDWTEEHRTVSIRRVWSGHEVDFPLLWKPMHDRWTIDQELAKYGIKRPRLYDLGAPHNNCGGLCVRAGLGHFRWALATIPEVYAEWEGHENELREQLGNVSILRDRAGGDAKPLPMREFRQRIEKRQVGQLDLDDWGGCGCFVDDGEG